MAGVTGLGGAFVRADDPAALREWYQQHLGLSGVGGAFTFPVATQRADAVLSFSSRADEYFPPAQPVMLNLQVDDLDAVLDRLIDEGVTVDPNRETYDFGRFGWFTDLEGNRVELWQPTD